MRLTTPYCVLLAHIVRSCRVLGVLNFWGTKHTLCYFVDFFFRGKSREKWGEMGEFVETLLHPIKKKKIKIKTCKMNVSLVHIHTSREERRRKVQNTSQQPSRDIWFSACRIPPQKEHFRGIGVCTTKPSVNKQRENYFIYFLFY